jgi:hypothetical protein
MQSPARHRDRFPIPPYSSGFPAPALNLKAADSLLTPLFVALPSISRLSPLSTAFTHFDGGVGATSIISRPQAESSDYSRHTAHFFAFFIFSSLQTPPLHNARRSIFNSFPLNHLQIPLSATPLFSHPYKMPGASPPLLPPPNARPRRRTRILSAIHCPSTVRRQA